MGEETLLSAIKGLPQLADVPEDKRFILANGDVVKSLLDLQVKFVKMDDEVFFQHVTPSKNDFASWIYHAVGDQELARQLGPAKTKSQNFLLVKSRVREIVSQKIPFKK